MVLGCSAVVPSTSLLLCVTLQRALKLLKVDLLS